LKSLISNSGIIPEWDWTNATDVNPWLLEDIAYHNFTYPTTTASYTGSSTAEPLGDLRWFTGFETSWNLAELVKKAKARINQIEESGGILGANNTLLIALQTEIGQAEIVATNTTATRANTYAAYSELLAALNNFANSVIVTGVQEEINSLAVVYPNPSHEFIHFKNLKEANIIVSIFNIQGIAVDEYLDVNENQQVNISHLPHGTYLIRIKTDKQTQVIKLIKQ
jgi:hypothetical protein